MSVNEKGFVVEQDWKGSRWAFTKSQSAYHFDPKREDRPGEIFAYLGKFLLPFEALISAYDPSFKDRSWRTRNVRDDLYSAPAEEADLISVGADPASPVFARTEAQDEPVFNEIAANIMGLTDYRIKIHRQTTGQMLHLHIDNFAGDEERENSFKVTDFDKNPNRKRRFAIQLRDWSMGQIWTFGNTYWSQWEAGECVTWDWKDIPHATANCGWEPRYMLQITGSTTPKTDIFLNHAQKEDVYDLTRFTA